jgi:hypothetical protein
MKRILSPSSLNGNELADIKWTIPQWLWEESPSLVLHFDLLKELHAFVMKLSSVYGTVVTTASLASATIWQNDQIRITNYPNTTIDASGYKFNTYPSNSTELAYKGRWDSQFTSWYSSGNPPSNSSTD